VEYGEEEEERDDDIDVTLGIIEEEFIVLAL